MQFGSSGFCESHCCENGFSRTVGPADSGTRTRVMALFTYQNRELQTVNSKIQGVALCGYPLCRRYLCIDVRGLLQVPFHE